MRQVFLQKGFMGGNEKDNNRAGRPGGAGGSGPMRQMLVWVAILLAVTLFFAMSNFSSLSGKVKQVSYSGFLQEVEGAGGVRITAVSIDNKTGDITGKYAATGKAVSAPDRFTVQGPPAETLDHSFNEWLTSKGVEVKYTGPSAFWEAMIYLLPILLIGFLFFFMINRQMRGAGGGPFSFGKSRAVRIEKGKNRKTFNDVAGIDEAREEVKEIVEYLRNPEKVQRLGGRLPHGVLLVGSPGTGKTLLAKAIAGEADVPFFSISGSDFVEMFVGVGASRVRDLFEQAKAESPCIIFLDEIDAVGRKRANDAPGSGQEAAQTLNAILVEMDGFTSDDKVIVMAATNRADVLDPALLRPGRFDRRINVDLPDINGREAILKVHVKNVRLDDNVNLSIIARGTPSFSGAELENVVNEAALVAAFTDKETVDMACFEEARDKVRWGKEKKSRVMRDEDRRLTAIHEAGHALLMTLLPHVTPLHKVSIIPRGRALGVTMQLPERDEYNTTRKKILGQISVALGGRAAEELFLDDISNGASSDIEQATAYVKAMICEWGMSEKLGMVNYSDRSLSGANNYFEGREFSEATAEKIDNEVRDIIDQRYQEAKKLLKKHEEDVHLVVAALMEFEVLSREEFDLLLQKRDCSAVREYRSSPRQAFARLHKEQADEETEQQTAEPAGIGTKDADATMKTPATDDVEIASPEVSEDSENPEDAQKK